MEQLLKDLQDQHQNILTWLGVLRDWAVTDLNPPRESIQVLGPFLDHYTQAVQSHHELEERILFEALLAIPQIQQGGPRCTHFMGLLISNSPIESLLEILGIPVLANHIPADLKPYFDRHSPLRIPLEEHIVGHLALGEIRRLIAASDSSPRLKQIILTYARLMDQHISKEDTCLFVRVPVLARLLESGFNTKPDQHSQALESFERSSALASECMNTLKQMIPSSTHIKENVR